MVERISNGLVTCWLFRLFKLMLANGYKYSILTDGENDHDKDHHFDNLESRKRRNALKALS